jgi:hypothetical protein
MARDSGLMRELGGMVLDQVRAALSSREALATRRNANLSTHEEPPVVAQLMIEIRSDGSHTIARGALNDLRNNETAQVHAEGRTPSELMLSLAGSLLSLPGSIFDATRHVKARVPKPENEEALPTDAPFPPKRR